MKTRPVAWVKALPSTSLPEIGFCWASLMSSSVSLVVVMGSPCGVNKKPRAAAGRSGGGSWGWLERVLDGWNHCALRHAPFGCALRVRRISLCHVPNFLFLSALASFDTPPSAAAQDEGERPHGEPVEPRRTHDIHASGSRGSRNRTR